MKAIISDIHANWEALQAVLQDAAAHRAREVYCLGGIVGYGPNPRECLDLLMQLELRVVLVGNHDKAVLEKPRGFFRSGLPEAVRWTQKQLDARVGNGNGHAADHRRQFLANRPQKHWELGCLYVHASPRNPLGEPVMPADAFNQRKMAALFEMVERACFMGYTHVPGIFTEDRPFLTQEEAGEVFPIGGRKVLCNVGSVGQPRDGDRRASYVLFDETAIRFRRVPYDLPLTLKKMRAVRHLNTDLYG